MKKKKKKLSITDQGERYKSKPQQDTISHVLGYQILKKKKKKKQKVSVGQVGKESEPLGTVGGNVK